MLTRVETASQLLQTREKTISQIRQTSDPSLKNWDALYGKLLRTAAVYYQQLPTRIEKMMLLDKAFSDALTALRRHDQQRTESILLHAHPNMSKYFAFAAALFYDLALPLTTLEVDVHAQGSSVLWNPMQQPVIGAEGTEYSFTWNRQKPCLRSANVHLAYLRLPEASRSWLGSNRCLQSAWISALSGDHTSELAPLLRFYDRPVQIPADRIVTRFLKYLQSAVADGKVNRRQDRIHRIKDGLFLEYPDVFTDFSVLDGRRLYAEIKNSKMLVPAKVDPTDPFWRFRTKSHPNKIIRGLVLDMQLDRSAHIGLSAYLTAAEQLPTSAHPNKRRH